MYQQVKKQNRESFLDGEERNNPRSVVQLLLSHQELYGPFLGKRD